MNIFNTFRDIIQSLLEDMGQASELPSGLDFGAVTVEPPRDSSHGDIACNAALVLAKQAGMKPRDMAGRLASRLESRAEVATAAVAGPGFINIRLEPNFLRQRLLDVLAAGAAYGDCDLGGGAAVNVEYVSANPTGPLHVGHCRGAVYGDSLANLLAKAGYSVTREYYINDAGAQVDQLARSVHLRYLEALGEPIGEIPEGLYPGDYLVEVGRDLAARDGGKWQGAAESEWLEPIGAFARAAMMDLIRADLATLGIEQEVFSSELALVEAGAVEKAMATLESRGLIYQGVLEPPKGKLPDDWEARPQALFRATDFGDDVDRPLRKSDGGLTYFASDIAYHLDKFERGFGQMIDVWGADHGGYVKRMKAAVTAITEGKGELDVKLCNLVKLFRDGRPVRMSKRSGQFVTLREVVDEVGRDVVRFIMLTRKNDAPLDFDFVKVTEQSRDNPVFYVQYAHARICSVFRNAGRDMPEVPRDQDSLANADLGKLCGEAELALIRRVIAWPRLVESAAQAHEPHRVAFYLNDLAADFHALWNRGNEDAAARFLIAGDAGLTLARLALIRTVALVIASGLAIMGVKPVEEMR